VVATARCIFVETPGPLVIVGTPGGDPLSGSVSCTSIAVGGDDSAYCIEQAGAVVLVGCDGTIIPIADKTMNGHSLAVDSMGVYWANDVVMGGSIMAAPLFGGPSATVAVDTDRPITVAVDANWIYWGDAAGHLLRAGK
jgi:hypothetical protein